MFHTRLWVLERDGHHYTCYLVDAGANGTEVRINRDGIEFQTWRFSTGAEAIAWAASQRAEIEGQPSTSN